LRKERHKKWEKELFGWDDGDVYVFHEDRGNFSIKKHPELHRRLVELAIGYFEEHGAKSEEELSAGLVNRLHGSEYQTSVSRYMSYLLRHHPQSLKMDAEGFVDIDELLRKIRARYLVDKTLILEIVDRSDRKRFEIKGNRIRALYGHTIPVRLKFEEDRKIKSLYHGTTPDAASKILKEGLKPMKRKWVHLSPTIGIAKEVGMRRTKNPVVLEIDAETAIQDGIRFYRATDKVYTSGPISPKYIKIVEG